MKSALVPLDVKLAVTPARVSGDTELDIHGFVRNIGASELDTAIWSSKLLVNGRPSESWAWAIANGLRDARELALPPAEQVEFRRMLASSSVLPQPGRYALVLEVQGVRSPEVLVERY